MRLIVVCKGLGPYAAKIKETESDIKKIAKNVNVLKGTSIFQGFGDKKSMNNKTKNKMNDCI